VEEFEERKKEKKKKTALLIGIAYNIHVMIRGEKLKEFYFLR
jgi:hypothetical protein